MKERVNDEKLQEEKERKIKNLTELAPMSTVILM